jgi:hypothetical protein
VLGEWFLVRESFFSAKKTLTILSTVLHTHTQHQYHLCIGEDNKRSGESVWMAKLENSHPDQEEGE